MRAKVFIDTNILVHSYEKDSSGKKFQTCFDIVSKCFRGEIELVVSNQVLAEFFRVITQKSEKPLSVDEAKSLIYLINVSSNWTKVNYSANTVLRAAEIVKWHRTQFWDALIIATMIENSISEIYTENAIDFQIPGISIINPLENK